MYCNVGAALARFCTLGPDEDGTKDLVSPGAAGESDSDSGSDVEIGDPFSKFYCCKALCANSDQGRQAYGPRDLS